MFSMYILIFIIGSAFVLDNYKKKKRQINSNPSFRAYPRKDQINPILIFCVTIQNAKTVQRRGRKLFSDM